MRGNILIGGAGPSGPHLATPLTGHNFGIAYWYTNYFCEIHGISTTIKAAQ